MIGKAMIVMGKTMIIKVKMMILMGKGDDYDGKRQ